jgi:ligand-binding sensor protein
MNEPICDLLRQCKTVQRQLKLFQKATGLYVTIEPVEGRSCADEIVSESDFCRLAKHGEHGCKFCTHLQRSLLRQAARKLSSSHRQCWAGLTHAVAPILVEGRHVANLDAGHVLDHVPQPKDFNRVKAMLSKDHRL